MQKRVLLSGATGLIGGELMLILAAKGVYSTAVVRAPDEAKATARLLERLQKSVLWKPEFAEFVSAASGDIESPDFGLSASVLQSADVILHSAASTSFKPDAGVYPVNIKAATNFGGILKNLKPSQRGFFVGTAAVTMEPRGVITEDMAFAGYANDYIRSKRDAETLLRAVGVPFISLRPGIGNLPASGGRIGSNRSRRGQARLVRHQQTIHIWRIDRPVRVEAARVIVRRSDALLALKP